MGNLQSTMDSFVRRKETGVGASGSLRNSGNVVTAFDLDGSPSRNVMAEGLTVEEYKSLVKGRQGGEGNSGVLDVPRGGVHVEPKSPDVILVPSFLEASELTVLTLKTDYAERWQNMSL